MLLADFGVARSHTVSSSARTFTGTPCYMAPEVLLDAAAGYDNKVGCSIRFVRCNLLGFGGAGAGGFY